eukprot:SAG31_NODE_40132_length_283_cov_0.592391_1_plen_27_part_10
MYVGSYLLLGVFKTQSKFERDKKSLNH